MAVENPTEIVAHAEILEGLKSQRERLSTASMNQAYFEQRNAEFIPQRPAESNYEYNRRPKRVVCLVEAAIRSLTQHLYNPGPNRTWSDEFGDQFLQSVYASNHINLLMRSVDQSTTLNGCSAIGIHATGDASKPVRLDLYGADEMIVWSPPDDPGVASAVATLASDSDRTTKICLWSSTSYREYESKLDQKPKLIKSELNPYGQIPFVFAHNVKVVRSFWEGGKGTYLRTINAEIDRDLSDIAQMSQYSIPIGLLRNASITTNLIQAPGRFNHLFPSDPENPANPEAFYLQPQDQSLNRFASLESYIYLSLEMAGIPRSAIKLDLQSGLSGIAILSEQLPLITYSQNRQPLFGEFESELAKAILACAGTFYRIEPLIQSSQFGELKLQWIERPFPLPIAEKDAQTEKDLANGFISKIQVVMSKFGFTRTQAIEHLKQVAIDEAELAPKPEPTPPTPEPAPEPIDDEIDPTLEDEQGSDDLPTVTIKDNQ